MATIRLADAAKHDEQQPHQLAAWNALQETLTPKQLEDFAALFRTAPAVKPSPTSNPLSVRWQSQLDNKSGTGYRECFSSSCAMLAMHWNKVANDDAYNAIRNQYGDSTDAQAQLLALRSLGLKANFHTDGTPASLEAEINAGRPVAVGWLHHGPVSGPSGGGHWSVVIGYTATAWIQNDPNGEANLVGGGYTTNTKGAGVVYSRKNWNPRWMPGGTGGWFLSVSPAG
jgi:hypothetical protein